MTKVLLNMMLVLPNVTMEPPNVTMEPSNMRKNKRTIECDKSTVTCDVGTAQCKDGTLKCKKKKSHVMFALCMMYVHIYLPTLFSVIVTVRVTLGKAEPNFCCESKVTCCRIFVMEIWHFSRMP